jgi:ABC-type branched-subunit amino acid transport system substrate-binding protein
MHKVKRKETIFSISREYGISEEELIAANPELKDEKLKRGHFLCIPYTTPQPVSKPKEIEAIRTDKELFAENKPSVKKISTLRAAIILPFTGGKRDGDGLRMQEYYEGVLLALDELKKQGTSVDLYVYNSGGENTSIAPILAKDELKQMDIIFGPLYRSHIKALADFAEKNKIRLIIPISRNEEVYQNPYIYQVNTPQSYLFSEVYDHFMRQFPQANVIIIDMKAGEEDKKEFVAGLKHELIKQNIPVQTIKEDLLNQATITALLKPDRQNIFIPTSATDITLNKIIPPLKMVEKSDDKIQISLFGYPEWQTYLSSQLDNYFELDTYFYSSFYTSSLLPKAKDFINTYHRWYAKEMINSYPKYGMLGYDTAMFFLTGLAKYGTGLEDNINKIDLVPVQTGFKFERVNNWGGFINKKVFFIHFTKDFSLVKLSFD